MMWKCLHPIVHLLDKVYAKGITLTQNKLSEIQPVIHHSHTQEVGRHYRTHSQ